MYRKQTGKAGPWKEKAAGLRASLGWKLSLTRAQSSNQCAYVMETSKSSGLVKAGASFWFGDTQLDGHTLMLGR